jgi:hypothetical protein
MGETVDSAVGKEGEILMTKEKFQIIAYIIWQTEIYLNPEIACYSNTSTEW